MPLEKARTYQNVVMKLSVLRFMVKSMSKRAKTDLNRGCEPFFAEVLNRVYGYALVDVNQAKLNAPAIDLADVSLGIAVQVTCTPGIVKVRKTIETFINHKLYEAYPRLVFLQLGEKTNFQKDFETQALFTFDWKKDIIDVDDILSDAESLGLGQLKALSKFLDDEMPYVSATIDPGSLLGSIDDDSGVAPTTARRYLLQTIEDERSPEWEQDLQSLQRLQVELMKLSRPQRTLIHALFVHGVEPRYGGRIGMPMQTFQQKLNFSREYMTETFKALQPSGLFDVDSDEDARQFELSWTLSGSGVDAFSMLKDFVNKEQTERLIIEGDFSILD